MSDSAIGIRRHLSVGGIEPKSPSPSPAAMPKPTVGPSSSSPNAPIENLIDTPSSSTSAINAPSTAPAAAASVASAHGGADVRYAHVSLGEDIGLVDAALRANHTMAVLPPRDGDFVYVRHRSTWRWQVATFADDLDELDAVAWVGPA